MRKRINSLYIHIPFCEHICGYCDFPKLFYNSKFSKPYLKALFYELSCYHPSNLKTIYVGGGTPTSLSLEEIESLLAHLKPLLAKDYEFTIEANAENLTEEKLKLFREYGVNRLSIGLESSDEKILKLMGRKHTFLDVKNIILKARQLGFKNINADLIFGYPNQNLDMLKKDLDNILSLNLEHISLYSLTVSKGTKFYNDGIKELNEDDSRIFYDFILNTLRKQGYKRYEISNFAKPGFESRHNLTYWRDENYYGIGLGASGFIDNIRYTNTKNLSSYLNHDFVYEKEYLAKNEEIEDFLLTNLRLEDGFLDSSFKKRFGDSFLNMFKNKLTKLKENNLIIINDDKICLSDEGLIILDRVLLELL